MSVAPEPDLAALERRLNRVVGDKSLLRRALLHAGAAKRGDRGNERLEFLGDRVLGLLVAEMLVRRFPDESEGALARRHAKLVSRDALAGVADAVALGDALILSKGDDGSGGRKNPAILADAMEAVIAALYLDGGLEAAGDFVRAHWSPLMEQSAAAPPRDSKTALQEWALGRGMKLPVYEVTAQSGPPHDPVFEIRVSAGGKSALAQGRSKRLAEQAAADLLLKAVESHV